MSVPPFFVPAEDFGEVREGRFSLSIDLSLRGSVTPCSFSVALFFAFLRAASYQPNHPRTLVRRCDGVWPT
jgi:hypothetical protein